MFDALTGEKKAAMLLMQRSRSKITAAMLSMLTVSDAQQHVYLTSDGVDRRAH
jgi:hypothetical protein